MPILDHFRRWFHRPPEGGAAAPPPRRSRAQQAEDEIRDLVFGGPPPTPTTTEPAWVDAAQSGAGLRPRPYLEVTERELEAHAREEDSASGAPPALPSPRGVVETALGAVLQPWRALPENFRLVAAAVAALFVVLGGFLPLVLEAVNAAFSPVTGR